MQGEHVSIKGTIKNLYINGKHSNDNNRNYRNITGTQ